MRGGDILPLELMARREDFMEGVALYLRQRTVSQGAAFAQPLTMVKLAANERVQPFITLQVHEAQRLMDELWQCGLRPTEGTGSAGQLAATERHLEDMRTLVLGRWMPGPPVQIEPEQMMPQEVRR